MTDRKDRGFQSRKQNELEIILALQGTTIDVNRIHIIADLKKVIEADQVEIEEPPDETISGEDP